MNSYSQTNQNWDEHHGTWLGGKAAGLADVELPNPLWIFGYGSLCWKPERDFEAFEQRPAKITGWKRLFAQKSMDHRGTVDFPGLVVTIVRDEDLAEIQGTGGIGAYGSSTPSETHGTAYLIPQTEAKQLVADLDFREKGGYNRALIDVQFTDGSCQSVVALVYTGEINNPNFYLPASLDEAAQIIAGAHGPSGPNSEYLFNLEQFLRKARVYDDHVMELTDQVKRCLSRTGLIS